MSGNGETVAAYSGRELVIWDIVTGKEKKHLYGQCRDISLSQDGGLVAIVTDIGLQVIHLDFVDFRSGNIYKTI